MWNVVAAYQIAALLQCRQGSAHTCFYVSHLIVPACLSGYLQRRTTHSVTLFGLPFHRIPHLVNLADAELRLVQQNEVFVKVSITIQHIASGTQRWVASGTTGFLHVVFQRGADVVVHHQPHVFLVHTHAKS